MGQLRTANKRHDRAILASRVKDKAIGRTLTMPDQPAAEAVRS
jgi:hypothetical protein